MTTSICKEPFSQNKQASELNSSLSQYLRARALVNFHSKRGAVETNTISKNWSRYKQEVLTWRILFTNEPEQTPGKIAQPHTSH